MGLSSLFQKKNNYFDKKITPQCGYCQFANRTKAENSVLCTKTGTFWDEKNSCPKFVYSPLKRVPVKQLKNEGIVSDEEIYVEVKDEEPEAKPAKEPKPVEEAKPAQETAPAPEAKETQPAQEAAAPAEEAKPAEQAPAEEAKAEQAPAEETKPVEIDPLDAAISSALADAAAFAQQNIPPKSE
jgi:hypothetical protein